MRARASLCLLSLVPLACDAIVGVSDIVVADASLDGGGGGARDASIDRRRPADVASPPPDAGSDARTSPDAFTCTAATCPGGCCDQSGTCQPSSDTQCGVGCVNCYLEHDGIACISGICGCNSEKDCPWGDGGSDVECFTAMQQCCIPSGAPCATGDQCCSGACAGLCE